MAQQVEALSAPQSNGYNTAFVQMLLLSLVFLCIPGAGWNAFSATGGGNVGDPNTYAFFNGTFNWFFGGLALLAPTIVNLAGYRVTLFIGGLGYPITIMLFYLCGFKSVLPGMALNIWSIPFGMCAALLWTSGQALLMSYPSPENRGWYQGVWWALFNVGGAGSSFCISFLGNLGTGDSPSAGAGTFFAFAAVTSLGCLVVLTLAPPQNVLRSDGKPLVFEEPQPILDDLMGMGRLIFDWRTLTMIPFMVYTNLCYGYQESVFPWSLDQPTKGLNAAFFWGAQCLGAVALGLITDAKGVPLKERAMRSAVFVGVFITSVWALAIYANSSLKLDGLHHKSCDALPDVECIRYNTSSYMLPMITYTLLGFSDSFAQCWCIWLLGQLSENPLTANRYSGLYKCFNSWGSASGFLIVTGMSPRFQVWMNTLVFVGSILLAVPVCRSLKDAAPAKEALVDVA